MRDVLYECFATHFCDTGQVMELHQLQGFNTNMTSCVTWIFRVWHDSFLYNTGQVTELNRWVLNPRVPAYHLNESCHVRKCDQVWMCYVTSERAMSHINESRHIWMSRVTYHWVTNSTSMRHELNMGHVPHIHPPSPSKFTPFCLEGLVQYMSLSADLTTLLCKRHV